MASNADTVQVIACAFLAEDSCFAPYKRCYSCRGIRASMTYSESSEERREAIETSCAFKDRRKLLDGVITFVSGETQEPIYPTISSWLRIPTVQEAQTARRQIAYHLLDILKAELDHIKDDRKVIRFKRELMFRITCDSCRSVLFAGAFLCTECGREWCADCHQALRPCSHPKKYIRHVSRFENREEILQTIKDMDELLKSGNRPDHPNMIPQKSRNIVSLQKPQDVPCEEQSEGLEDRTLWHKFNDSLRLGVPLVITESTRDMPGLDFVYLSTALGSITIKLVSIDDPEKEVEREAGSFFQSILSGDPEVDKWKLKDFPPKNAFKEVLEPVAQWLDRGWSFRAMVATNGPLNLMAHFPCNPGIPKSDLGPKMYSSPAVSDDNASTPTHVDMSDALNVHMSSVTKPGVDTGKSSATWIIFPSDEDSYRRLHQYLEDKFRDDPRIHHGDIIHSQWVVFTSAMLEELEQKYSLRPWIIEQQPGDTIFIPSRCPHMVRNSAWSIKTATDFLAGDALPRTARVQRELRIQRLKDPSGEDVLQLPLVLWHAWVSLTQQMPNIRANGIERKALKRRLADHGSGDSGTSGCHSASDSDSAKRSRPRRSGNRRARHKGLQPQVS